MFTGEFSEAFDELAVAQPAAGEDYVDEFCRRTRGFPITAPPGQSKHRRPLSRLAPLFQQRDVVLLNLETPLASHARPNGLFVSEPEYAPAMKEAGVTMVCLANNHIFDAGEMGFRETLSYLKAAGIASVGAGEDLESARSGTVIECKGTRLAFLAYTQYCNSRFASAANAHSGILPLDRHLIVEDVKRVRQNADVVIVSLHWGFENQPCVHPRQRHIAHLIIEAGADCIVGHHPHVPHGIEIHNGKPIFYSLGNLVFAQQNHHCWSDNFLVELVVENKRLKGSILHPVAGRAEELIEPYVLRGERAMTCLRRLQLKSLPFRTGIAIHDDLGYVDLSLSRSA